MEVLKKEMNWCGCSESDLVEFIQVYTFFHLEFHCYKALS